ncbi:MAG TPA: outer membrane beta-barrel protein [Candidatus Acidoferrum sp.]|nr:outer membrane beta-barrel protein [Candidatus Acidoferrum sp.]
MKKPLMLLAILLSCGIPAFAQGTVELGAGYAFRSFDQDVPPQSSRVNMNGFDVNGAFHLFPWLAVAGDITGTYSNQGVSGDNKLYSFMAGPRVYPFGHGRISPYVQAEFGGSHYQLQISPANGGPFTDTERGFAWSAGGGVDVFLTNHLGLKGQLAFEQTRFFQDPNKFPPPSPSYQKNFVLVVGPVIRF